VDAAPEGQKGSAAEQMRRASGVVLWRRVGLRGTGKKDWRGSGEASLEGGATRKSFRVRVCGWRWR
jgi:hypothetical protein